MHHLASAEEISIRQCTIYKTKDKDLAPILSFVVPYLLEIKKQKLCLWIHFALRNTEGLLAFVLDTKKRLNIRATAIITIIRLFAKCLLFISVISNRFTPPCFVCYFTEKVGNGGRKTDRTMQGPRSYLKVGGGGGGGGAENTFSQ